MVFIIIIVHARSLFANPVTYYVAMKLLTTNSTSHTGFYCFCSCKHNFSWLATVQLNLNLTFTCVWHENIWTNFLCHSQVSHDQIIKMYIYTCVTLESLNKFIRSLMNCMQVLNKFVGPLTSCMQVHDLMHLWSAQTYHFTCKIQAWPWHLRIRLQPTHHVVYSHWSLFHQLQPVIIQYRPDCYLDRSVSA